MHYLLCALWLIGGGPKYSVDGHFMYAGGHQFNLSAAICREGNCKELKLNDDLQFDLRLKPGTYELRYTNSWHQQVSQELLIQTDTMLAIDVGEFQPRESYPVWEAFQSQGKLTIAERIESRGHYWERVITFEHNKGAVVVEVDDPQAKVKALEMLSPMEAFQLEDFLRKVDLFDKSEGCESSTLYLMQAGVETFIIEDGSCDLLQLDTILLDLYVRNYVSQEVPLYSN